MSPNAATPFHVLVMMAKISKQDNYDGERQPTNSTEAASKTGKALAAKVDATVRKPIPEPEPELSDAHVEEDEGMNQDDLEPAVGLEDELNVEDEDDYESAPSGRKRRAVKDKATSAEKPAKKSASPKKPDKKGSKTIATKGLMSASSSAALSTGTLLNTDDLEFPLDDST